MFEVVGVDVVLILEVVDVYFVGDEIIVEIMYMVNMLYGKVCPGYFCGVIMVVVWLFNFIQFDIVCFGEKDYQQF